jgi:hypothetical protein
MGLAVFPLRINDSSRVMINSASWVAIKENPPGDLTGQADVYLNSGAVWYLEEDVLTVYNRLRAAETAQGPVFPP